MKRPTTWVLCFLLFQLSFTPGTDALTILKIRRNITLTDGKRSLIPQASIGIPRRVRAPWAQMRAAFKKSLTTSSPTVNATLPTPNEEAISRRSDIIDNSLSVVWPLRTRRPSNSKRFRAPTPTTPTPQVLLKLLQPKPTRPAIYSLDGFVPKPSLRQPPTEAPPAKTDLQQLASSTRRRKTSRYSSNKEDVEDEDEDELQSVSVRRRKKPVSRYTAFARKGVAGEDFPVLTFIPLTDFDCGPHPGLYADPFTDCQVWHMCPGGHLSPRHSFLCPNGTIFNQKKRICDWWYNVDCEDRLRSG